jgi:hypothetical protein
VLICTDLMARGVDFKGVQMVINYDLPQVHYAYMRLNLYAPCTSLLIYPALKFSCRFLISTDSIALSHFLSHSLHYFAVGGVLHPPYRTYWPRRSERHGCHTIHRGGLVSPAPDR